MLSASTECDKDSLPPMEADQLADDETDYDDQDEDVMSPSNKGTDEAANDALLEKLVTCASKPHSEAFRNVAAKIHARVTSTVTVTSRIGAIPEDLAEEERSKGATRACIFDPGAGRSSSRFRSTKFRNRKGQAVVKLHGA
ncbi:uncharacterized protein LOC143363268 [Halictus rubicundus]|uniref:uncharacterized protein LOC143363268 n=1 Tax=Halictus rubicundus TaxID=77578 RepID=UPI0040369B90